MSAREQGMTLLELMVAMSIGAILMLVLHAWIVGVKHVLQRQEKILEFQQAGLFFTYYMGQQLRQAGWNNCAGGAGVGHNLRVKGLSYAQAHRQINQPLAASSDVLIIYSCHQVEGEYRFLPTSYFVTNSAALYEKITSTVRVELLSGVKQMQVRFSVLNGGGIGVSVLPAEQVADWNLVRGVAVTLMLDRPWYVYVALR